MGWLKLLPFAIGFATEHLVKQPIRQPAGYRKYIGMIVTGIAGCVGLYFSGQLGVEETAMAGFVTVLTAIVGNLLPNK